MDKKEKEVLFHSLGEIFLILGAIAISQHLLFISNSKTEWVIFLAAIIFVFIGVYLKVMPPSHFNIFKKGLS